MIIKIFKQRDDKTILVWETDYSWWGGGGGAVDSVFSRTWAVVSENGDYNAWQITNTPAWNIASVTVQWALNELDTEKVAWNTAIVWATKTKITYDAKGLVTAWIDATTADIADSTNRRYVTDPQLVVIGNTSNTNTWDETTITLWSKINWATEKTTPVDADMFGLMDSEATNVLKKLSWANIKATLKTYFDSLNTILTNKTLALWSNTISGTKAEFNTACTDWNFVYEWATTTSWLTMSTGKLLWRSTTWTWAIEEITLWTGLSFTWTTLNASGGWWGVTPIRITIPWELIDDTAVQQGLYWYNNTGATITISNVAFTVSKAAAWAGAACAFNVYKSSGTVADWLDTNAVNLFTSAVNLTTNYTSLTNVPNTTTVESGRYVSARVTSSAGATNKASNAQIIITYT